MEKLFQELNIYSKWEPVKNIQFTVEEYENHVKSESFLEPTVQIQPSILEKSIRKIYKPENETAVLKFRKKNANPTKVADCRIVCAFDKKQNLYVETGSEILIELFQKIPVQRDK